jgi:capsular exopolysaccharide synthesis family protein
LYAGDGYPGNGQSAQGEASPLYDEGADAPPSGVERLRALLGTLWGGKWIVLGVFALVVGAAAFYTYTRTPQYQTSTLLLVDLGQSQSPVPSLTGGASGQSMFGGSQRNLSNQILVLNQSDALAREVAYRLDTMRTHPRTGAPLELLTTPTGEERPRAALAGLLKGRVQARSSGQNVDAIQITATGPVPEETALIANEYADAYIDRTRAKSQESVRARRLFLEDQVDQFSAQVDSADEALASYMQEEGAVSLDQESSRLVQQTSQLEARHDELRIELDMAESALSTKRQELERIRPRLAERLSSGIQTELQQVQQEKARVAGEINRVRTRNPNLDPTANTQRARDLRRLQRRAQRLETQADSLASDYVERTLAAGGIGAGGGGSGEGESSGGRGVSYVVQLQREIAQQEIQVNGLRAQINTVENQIEENRTRLQNLPPKSLRLADLQRQKQSMEQTYGFLRQKLQETRMQEESEVGFAERIRSAGVPGRPISPNSQRNLMLAAMLGLLLGGGLVVLREKLDTRLRGPGDVEALGEHVLGVVPSMEETIKTEFDGQRTLTINGDEVRSTLIMLTSPMSAAAEAYRRLRTNLRYAQPDADLRSMVVTSAAKGEGKTTTATNLAVAQAQAGQKTLLIDADLRKSRLHRFFDVPRTPGLTEALYDTPNPDDLPVIADNLSLLPGGEEVPNPAELLGAQRMRALLDRMEQAFDLVIVDTAPVLLFSDPMALVAHTDGALLVAAAGETEGPALEHAAARLDDVQATRLGVVLNGFNPEDQRGGYGYGAYGAYGYGYGAYGYAYDEDLEAYYEDDQPRSPRSVTARVQSWWNGR